MCHASGLFPSRPLQALRSCLRGCQNKRATHGAHFPKKALDSESRVHEKRLFSQMTEPCGGMCIASYVSPFDHSLLMSSFVTVATQRSVAWLEVLGPGN
ncbi:hypothetical protein SKAU_G00285920 [Synaphobranchus kaupii]|uniref:Uncharacterized protein n=1 Tax=Synaphobranchus kaupii TaxID=118154 RepID=A0A9Q1EY02_SYNKA|nr:hypothetical protein SKAU_G00285920 [Synaphobranchus kaupii]